MDNANTNEYLTKIKNDVIQNLSRTKFAPSAQMQDVPHDLPGMDDEAEAELDDLDEDENKDVRHTSRRWDKEVEREGELSDSEDEAENARNGVLRQGSAKPRRNIMDYQNPNAVPDSVSNVATPASTPARAGSPARARSEGSPGSDKAEESKVEDVEMETVEEPTKAAEQGDGGAEAASAAKDPADVEMGEADAGPAGGDNGNENEAAKETTSDAQAHPPS